MAEKSQTIKFPIGEWLPAVGNPSFNFERPRISGSERTNQTRYPRVIE
jgi:hypothetical protein